MYSQRFFRPISDMSEKFNILQAAMASSERIFKLLDEPVSIVSRATHQEFAHRSPKGEGGRERGHIVFDHVWFAYNPTDVGEPDYVLRDVSFEMKAGERLGIVGATGAGKSTLINLLLRFYDVTRGRILVDGMDVREMDLHELRSLFSLVLQDVHLFTGTNRREHPPRRGGDRRRARADGGHRGPRGRLRLTSPGRLCGAGRRTRRHALGGDRSSCSRSRARSPSTRASWSSTKRRRASTPRPRS
jgi:hypothetical protein